MPAKKRIRWEAILITGLILLLIAFAIYMTKRLLPLWGLLIIGVMGLGTSDTTKTKCPKCGWKFLTENLDDEDKESTEKTLEE